MSIKIRDMKKLFVLLLPFIASAQIDNAAVQAEFAKLINAYRAENGIAPLTINLDAQKAALIQSDYLASTLRFENNNIKATCGHRHPEFPTPSDRLNEVNPELFEKLNGVGENAATFFENTDNLASNLIAKQLFTQWKESPAHNAQMLDGDYTYFGIAASVETVTASQKWPDGNVFETTYIMYASALVFLMPASY